MKVRTLLVALAAATVCVALPGAARALDPPSASCNGGGCDGWFTSNVSVSWSFNSSGATGASGCGGATVTEDTSESTFTCTVNYGGSFVGSSVTVHKDSSPPSVTGGASRGPDANGWYTSPVSFSFTGDDGASGVASCTSGTYSGPDGPDVTVSGSCRDNAGNTGSTSLKIKFDATAPTVAGTLARKPDANGWYNHPVDVAYTGTDAGSGISECSPTVSYKGPDADPAKLVGQCRDAAGHLSEPTTVMLRYDGTPPARPNLRWVRRGGTMSLSWTAGKDVVWTRVLRAPGPKTAKPAVVYQGRKHAFLDKKLRTGTRYWYEVTLVDRAGNAASKTIGTRPTGTRPSSGDLGPGRRRGRRAAARRPVGAGEQGAVLQPPAVAGEREVADHVGQAAEARTPPAVDVEGHAALPRRRQLPPLRLAGVRNATRAPLRQARRPGLVRGQGSLTPAPACARTALAAPDACARIVTKARQTTLASTPPAL